LERDWRCKCDALVQLARSFRVTSDYTAATQHLDQAERLLRRFLKSNHSDENLWLELQEQRVWLLYMKRDVHHIGPVLQRMAPVVRRRGTAIQLASFYMWSANDLVVRNRYQFSATAVAHERESLSLLEGAQALPQLAMTEFDLAFMLLLGDLEHCPEALAHLARALALAEQLGDSVLAARVATYFAIAKRRLGHVRDCQHWARAALEQARLSGVRGYVGAAQACLGWVAWRRGDLLTALDAFAEAQTSWWHRRDGTGARARDEFPFQWLAHLPLLALHSSQDDFAAAYLALDELVAQPQQQLAAAVHEPLRAAHHDWRHLSEPELERRLAEITRLASRHGYV
jgi:hypothetical protein